ncbi:hypothetical protein EEB11_19270 [Pseudotabrizicola sediminis]|uniref:Uncharacterized protein n=1 Tax=Pseudotabrizicola sediminis TaxID=2486418 RepID=A0ABY2KGG5_9RHOB|nr:hypothetical protein EEB11_19270 [Pseudotabrizicola sediminis]
MFPRNCDGIDGAIAIQPDLTPADDTVDILVNCPRAINAHGLTTTVYANMNCLGSSIRIVVFKNADFGGHRSI